MTKYKTIPLNNCHPSATFPWVPLSSIHVYLFLQHVVRISILKVPIWKDSTESVQWNFNAIVYWLHKVYPEVHEGLNNTPTTTNRPSRNQTILRILNHHTWKYWNCCWKLRITNGDYFRFLFIWSFGFGLMTLPRNTRY